MVNALYGHQERRPLASVQTTECYSPSVCLFVKGKKDWPLAFEIKLGVYHSNFHQYHSGKMPSAMQILSHTQQKLKD